MERRPGGARSLYLLHRVSEKPSSLCKEKADPQVGFQSPSASGLGELMFCWWTQRSVGELEMLCACQASPGPRLGKNELSQLSRSRALTEIFQKFGLRATTFSWFLTGP